MSRIFEALQRSESERSGVEYPDMVSVVTEVFEAPKEQRASDEPLAERAATVEAPTAPTDTGPTKRHPADRDRSHDHRGHRRWSCEVPLSASERHGFEPAGVLHRA